MKRFTTILAIFVIAVTLGVPTVFAAGTAADTPIINTARVDYQIGTNNLFDEDSVTTRVAQLLDVTVVCNTPSLNVSPGQNLVLSKYTVTNTGNGPDTFRLASDSSLTTTGDTFDPTLQEVWLDDNGNGVFDGSGPGNDVLYNAGVNDPTLLADASIVVWHRNNIPAGVVNDDKGDSELMATSTLQSAPLDPAGTVYAGAGANGVNAIVGNTQASASDICRHLVLSVLITISKQADVLAAYNTNTVIPGVTLQDPIPGAVLTYTLTVSAAGAGTATNVIVTDTIPANTTYKAGNFTLDTNALGEASGDGDVGELAGNTITVSLPDMTGGEIHTITFNVTID